MHSPHAARSRILLPTLLPLLALTTASMPAAARPPRPGERMFLPAVTVGSAEAAKKLITADFNRDGKPDFAVLHWEIDGRGTFGGRAINKGFLVRVFLNQTAAPTPTPTLAESARLWYDDDGTRTYPMYDNDLAAADVNGDGVPDLLVASAHADRVFVYLGRGDGTFLSPPGEALTEDDPCYLAVGDFNGDGKADLAVQHFVRHIPGGNYTAKFSFLFGRGDGTFGSRRTDDAGSFSFPPPDRGPGPYYYSDGWGFAVAPRAVRLPDGSLRDGVWLGEGLAFFTTFIGGNYKAARQFIQPWGSSPVEPSEPPLVAVRGGRVIYTRVSRLGDITLNKYDGQLDGVFVDADGNSRLDHFGAAVALADFDVDGTNDLALLSNERGGPGGHHHPKDHSAYSFLVAYGIGPAPNPLDLAGAGFDLKRFREIPRSGLWWSGHRPPTAVVADFNLDEFPDLLVLTAGGIDFHPNAGLWGIEILPPRLEDISGLGSHAGGTEWGDDLSLYGDFVTGGRPTVAMLVREVPPSDRIVAVVEVQPDPGSPRTRLFASLPPDDLVTPGDYTLSVWNGAAESFKRFPVKVVLRPVKIDGVDVEVPLNSFPRIEVRGFFFGRTDRDDTQFSLEALPPGTGIERPLSIDMTATEATFEFPAKPGRYVVKVENPQRGVARSAPIDIPDLTPTLDKVRWLNPGWSAWIDRSNTDGPVHPGARFQVFGRFYRAPEAKGWVMGRGLTSLASGTGNLEIFGAIPNDNTESGFVFTLPGTLSEGSADLFIHTGGDHARTLLSAPVRLWIVKPPTGGGGGSTACTGPQTFAFAVEGKAAPHLCDAIKLWAKDQAEADRCIRAGRVVPDDYVYTKVDVADLPRVCSWEWEYDLLEADGTLKETRRFKAASREIADAQAKARTPTGGSAVFKSGPIK